jgi:hypothetical protein
MAALPGGAPGGRGRAVASFICMRVKFICITFYPEEHAIQPFM